DKLYKQGYVTRTRSTEDRRSIVLALTEDGERAFRDLEIVRKNYLQDRFGTLTEEELETMVHVFNKILQTMDEDTLTSSS
ncbi:MAG: MarR family winged helix-turn-helix transcriptional regulator, partial [Exiguobacterium acetylicum]